MKTAERAHTPKELWESIKLDPSYNKALAQIEQELKYWPNFLKHKCKQRFTRLRQILVKRKKMKIEGSAEYKIISRKAEKREKSRLIKAEKSAVIENHIVDELLKNLKNGKYDEIYNYDHNAFNKILEKENVLTLNEQEESFNENDFDKGYIEDFSDEENEDSENNDDNECSLDNKEIDDIFNSSKNKTADTNNTKFGKKKRKIELNYEYEYEKIHNNENLNIKNNNSIDDYI